MVRYSGAWGAERVDAFLAEAVVPVRLACRTPAGPLWMLSLWYRWLPDETPEADGDEGRGEGDGAGTGDGDEDGDGTGAGSEPGDGAGGERVDSGGPALRCATSRDADVVRYLEADDGVAFEVSTNEPPYRGVRGNGTATVVPDEGKRLLRSLLERYLGGTDSALARRLLDPEREEVEIRVEPARVHSWDYAGRMRDATGGGEGGGGEGRGGRT
jgi:hypothetical protein